MADIDFNVVCNIKYYSRKNILIMLLQVAGRDLRFEIFDF